MNKKMIYLVFLLMILSAFSFSAGCSNKASQYVVIGQPELMIQIEGNGDFEFMVVEANDKRFSSPVPMFNKGTITGLNIENQLIELLDGNITNGFIVTKDYGKVRILGVNNPVYLWVTPDQKDSLMKLK